MKIFPLFLKPKFPPLFGRLLSLANRTRPGYQPVVLKLARVTVDAAETGVPTRGQLLHRCM